MKKLLNLHECVHGDVYGLIIGKLTQYDLIFVYIAHGYKFKINRAAVKKLLKYLAFRGYTKCIRYLHNNSYYYPYAELSGAIKGGHINCIKYVIHHDITATEAIEIAAKYGRLNLVKYFKRKGGKFTCNAITNAARRGHLECLEYLHKNGCEWDTSATLEATKYGHLKCLRYAHDNGCRRIPDLTEIAALYGQLECLQYAHDNGYEWSAYTVEIAAIGGHFDCLKYAIEHGCNWSARELTQDNSFARVMYIWENHQIVPVDRAKLIWGNRSDKNYITQGHLDCANYINGILAQQ